MSHGSDQVLAKTLTAQSTPSPTFPSDQPFLLNPLLHRRVQALLPTTSCSEGCGFPRYGSQGPRLATFLTAHPALRLQPRPNLKWHTHKKAISLYSCRPWTRWGVLVKHSGNHTLITPALTHGSVPLAQVV